MRSEVHVVRQVCPYPPGIPVLLPGERVTASAVRELLKFRYAHNLINHARSQTNGR